VTVYPRTEEKVVVSTTVQAILTIEEEQLLRRYRQIRRQGSGELLLVDPRTAEIRVVGGVERLAKSKM
jgi:hypothetical protein